MNQSTFFCTKTMLFRHFKEISIGVWDIISSVKNLESKHHASVVSVIGRFDNIFLKAHLPQTNYTSKVKTY